MHPGSGKRSRVGREPESGLYYEILGDGERVATPLLFIHGGGNTGSGFRGTPDGRIGWTDLLAERGYRSWVTDWPGTGRSGYRDILTLQYADVVDGYLRLLREVIKEPVIVLPHSMGGPITWKLVEQAPELVVGVVGIAAGYPGNLAPKNTQVVGDDGNIITFRFGDTGVEFILDRRKPYVYEDAYVFEQMIATSTQFPREYIPQLRAGHMGMSPYMLLQRTGVISGMPVIDQPAGFQGKTIRLVAGTDDPAHTRAIEERTAQLLSSWGADAKVVWLGDRGLVGNGHVLTGELNYEAVLEIVVEQISDILNKTHR
jgi:pimeloyl-ACP methyl ester carboxylesterase